MKKIILLLAFAIFTVSCGGTYELLELKVNNDLRESIVYNIPKTQGVEVSYSHSKTFDLTTGDLAQYVDKITAIKINSLTYKFKDFIGNTAARISSGTLKFNYTVIGSVINLNVSQAVNQETIFTITDSTVLNQLENTLLNSNSATIDFSGSALSDAGAMDFTLEVNISLTATITE